MRVSSALVPLLLLVLVFSASPVLARESGQAGVEPHRMDLFVASQRLLAEEQNPPKMKVGMVLTTLGADSEVSMGVRVETSLGQLEQVSVVTETIYLKAENTLAGFLSIKFVPLPHMAVPVYIGAGAGYADGFRYQAFVGVDLTKNFFAEARYVNVPGGIGDRGLYLAAGFQFVF